MSHLRAFKQKLSAVNRLWEEKDYDLRGEKTKTAVADALEP
jgi:hypothetical protein